MGDGFKKDATQLEKLLDYKNDEKVLKQILEIKSAKKMELKKALMEKQNVTINENSIFDIQIKRLHEYKRQQLNALYVIHKYLEIKAGKKPSTPITVIFGAKAAPAYIIAQDIIHLILCLQQLINNDPEVSPYLNVVMVENYNVTWAEKLIPACDISEQISLASKEASGTGNMKFMLNGALTLGTEDGANVEIHELVGDDNIYIFGDSSDTVVERYAQGSYHAAKYYNENATESYLNYGGNYEIASRRLAQWCGPVKELLVPYDQAVSTISQELDDTYAFDQDEAHLQNAYLINVKENASDVKSQIMDHGAAGVMYYHDNGSFGWNSDLQEYTYYDATVSGGGHAVMIVGWDDNFFQG